MMAALEQDTLHFLTGLEKACMGEDWFKTLDALTTALRKGFVFDNLALYLAEKSANMPEAIYARAVGRGRSAEADVSWGGEIANQVITTMRRTQINPGDPSAERVRCPYLLGLPISLLTGHGALVFVRFGGPEYDSEQITRALMAACMFSRVYERRFILNDQDQLAQARHRSQLQDDFISTVSHDLRTPIGFIKGYTTSLLRQDTTWNPETQREFLTIIDEESDHLRALIDRMLDSARLQNGMMVMDFQLLRMDALIRDVVQRITSRNPELVVHLNLKSSTTIRGDSNRLAQVFDNLIDNAIKYAPGSDISISTQVLDGRIKILFSDHGPGIPPEHMQLLFERFYRVPDSNSNRGTGLGLFICREILRAHSGSISVASSTPGKGTDFCIELPAANRKGVSP